ncbi:MAG: hypothetical protein AABZ55_07330 [Bdellovibrionota bacterium]
MNCFEWQTRASDHLDGTLIASLKKEADSHIDSCKECSERLKHFRSIISSIAAQSRSTLPVPIRKAPLSAHLPRLDMARIRRSRWERLPWYVRTTIEGTGVVFLIVLGISTGPRLRGLYERSVEKSLSDYTETADASAQANLPANMAMVRGKVGEAAMDEGGEDEVSGENEEDEDQHAAQGSVGDDEDIRVGSSEIWRFSLLTDSPRDLRLKVVQILSELRVSPNTPGIGGIQTPGGIQFDLILSQSTVSNLKKQLQRIAPKPAEGAASSGGTFTWYKTKSRRKIPEGKTRVMIWLSQI